MENTLLSVSDFIALTNQTLEYAYPVVTIEGEVSSFKLNQGKFVFFDLKDDVGSVGCFMMAFQLRLPVEDGMKVIVTATPKLTQWGKFSLTIKSIRPSGEGSLKKSFDLLKEKLDKEGLFALDRKRALPIVPRHVGVITSTDAAGYADFVKILNDRWGGLKVEVAHVQVQGASAPDQMIRALKHFNEQEEIPEVILLLRGGGSADDLASFNDELLVRAIAASRVPTIVGVGHEVDVTLADLAADVRAATPSNAAQILVPDRHELIRGVRMKTDGIRSTIVQAIDQFSSRIHDELELAYHQMSRQYDGAVERLETLKLAVAQINPQNVLRRGYALLRGEQKVGAELEIETYQTILKAEVKYVSKK